MGAGCAQRRSRPGEGGIEHVKLGTRRVERRERQGEGKHSGRASETSSGVDGRAGSSIGEEGLRGGNVTTLATSSPLSLAASTSRQLSPSRQGLLQPRWRNDESSMRRQLTGMKLGNLRKERDQRRIVSGSKTRRKKRGSCSRGNQDWDRGEEFE